MCAGPTKSGPAEQTQWESAPTIMAPKGMKMCTARKQLATGAEHRCSNSTTNIHILMIVNLASFPGA